MKYGGGSRPLHLHSFYCLSHPFYSHHTSRLAVKCWSIFYLHLSLILNLSFSFFFLLGVSWSSALFLFFYFYLQRFLSFRLSSQSRSAEVDANLLTAVCLYLCHSQSLLLLLLRFTSFRSIPSSQLAWDLFQWDRFLSLPISFFADEEIK